MCGNDFDTWLQRQLKRREWSQSDFARAGRFSTSTVSDWVRGNRVPDPPSCDLIADALGMDVQDVLRHAGHLPDVPNDSEHVRELTALLRRIDWTPDRLRFVRTVLLDLATHTPTGGGSRIPSDLSEG